MISFGELYGGVNQKVSDLPDDADKDYCAAYADMEAAVHYMRESALASNIVVWGSSYSGALVFQLATKHPDFVTGVIAFSPSTGNSVAECRARKWLDDLSALAIVFRAESEMSRDTSLGQRKILIAAGVETIIVKNGVHGSSALIDERTGHEMKAARSRVIRWLDKLRTP